MSKKSKYLNKNYKVCCSNSKVASENSKRFEIDSSESFTKIRVDDCVIKGAIEKCDFSFLRNNDDVYFVELKGSDIKKAYSQILNTIKYFDANIFASKKNAKYAFIVSSRIPKAGTSVKNLKQDFVKKHGKLLQIQNKTLTYKP